MFTTTHTHSLIFRLRALAAAGGIALVLALNILAASPTAHEHVHADAAHADHECAITLFAHGVAHSLGIIAVPVPTPVFQDLAPAIGPELFLLAPRYLRLPERGPPAS